MLENSGFVRNQIKQIEQGRQEGLDVSIYARPEFTSMHMQQIRMGLLDGLAVEKYADPSYDWFQMEEIRKGMLEGINIEGYASPEIPYEKMRQVRKGLMEGVDLVPYLQLDAGILRQLRKAIAAKVNIIPFIREGYQPEQLEQIRQALEKKLEIGPYLTKELRGTAIREIGNGLEDGVDVAVYATPQYNWQQMREIRLGLENRLEVSLYVNPFFGWQQMQEIRLGLEEGLDARRYARLMYTATDMKKIRQEMQKEFSVEPVHKETMQEHAGNFWISISDNEMEAYLVCERPGTITRDQIRDMLREEGVVEGIDENAIGSIPAGKVEAGKTFLLASGVEPQDGRDGWYEYFFRLEVARTPKHLEDGTVDYQDIEWFEVVEENQKIAYYHEAEQGKNGYTVTGIALPAHKGKEQSVLRGRGFRLLPDGKTYIAAMNGRIELQGKQLLITKLFIFDEITMATGNVNVDGNVYVRGNVGSRTIIKATGDIVVDGFIESAYLESDADMFLRQGMNASGEGALKAAGNIAGKFFEAVKVQAGADIRANYCLNSELYAGRRVTISGEKGSLVGGKTYGAQGISVFHVGNRSGVPTGIKVGIDELARREKRRIEKEIGEVKKELAVFRDAYVEIEKRCTPEVRNSMELYIKVENAIYTKEKELEKLKEEEAKLQEKWKAAKEAAVAIRGTLYEGVEFEINELRWTSRSAQNIRIKRVNNRIAVYKN